jgi:hypothetical protein
MATSMKFIPTKKSEVLTYATQVHNVLSATGFVPTSLGLTAADVTELGTILTAAQAAHDAVNAAKLEKQAKTQALSAPGGAHDQLVAKLRAIATAARVSDASDEAVATIGVSRKSPSPSPKSLPASAPAFTLVSVSPGIINVRFRVEGSAKPRARDTNAIGVQVAVVNGATAPVDDEADAAPDLFVPRSPASLDSTNMPGKVRLYARWISQRGETGPWSLPLGVAVL